MSARNYLSAREKLIKYDCLPEIKKQKFRYRSGTGLPPLSANTSAVSHAVVNRNIQVNPFGMQSFLLCDGDRVGTPFSAFSDFFSGSEMSTPDFRSEESDSSSGSALRRSTAEATKILADEWERIERTLYDEDGEKCTRPQMIEECKQWKALHPQLRVTGRAIQLPEKNHLCTMEYDEVVSMHYSDYSEFSESEERCSQSSNDVTPQNSPRPSFSELTYEATSTYDRTSKSTEEKRLSRHKKSSFLTCVADRELPETFCSLLHITPLQAKSPPTRKRQNASIVKSDIASSRWMKTSRPDSSLNCDRNSAKSFVSLDTSNYGNLALSASEHSKFLNIRVATGKHRDIARLEPLFTPDISQSDLSRLPSKLSHQYNIRKVSLPPLLLEEEKKNVPSSGKKAHKLRKNSKSSYQLDRIRHSK